MIMRYLLTALCLAGAPLALAQTADSDNADKESVTVYRYVNADGQLVYTNEPREGAEAMEIEMPNAMDSREPPPRQAPEEADETGSPYDGVRIDSPAAEETVRNTGGVVQLSFRASPGLLDGHRYRVNVAGRSIETRSGKLTLEEVPRGIHEIQIDILDSEGEVIFASEAQEFYVKQHSVLHGS